MTGTVMSLVLVIACTKKQKTQSVARAAMAGTTAVVSSAAPARLAVSTGVNGEAFADIPVNAFPDGTEVTAQLVDAPKEFTDAAASSAADSGALRFSAVSKGEELSQASAPFTISIPQNVAAALTQNDSEEPEICAFLLANDGSTFVWRKSDFLTLDTEKGVASFKTTYLGTFQLILCGTEKVSNFVEASEEGITGIEDGPLAAISDAPEGFACPTGTKSIFTDYAAVEECRAYLDQTIACNCTLIENLTQTECESKIQAEVEASVCVDQDHEVSSDMISAWQTDCSERMTANVTAFGEICGL
jgi:hypothetical protein